ncbi:MAG: hypothetical protein K1X66_01815 [Verrucomicrobiae bacterium]|nr:hypothetical protein [Verrucomicrobiae bacterium]
MNKNNYLKFIVLINFFLFNLVFVKAEIVKNALKNYVETKDSERDDMIKIVIEADENRQLNQPIRFGIKELATDINGDGKDELLFTANGHGGKAYGNYWTIYIPVAGGYKRIKGDDENNYITFHSKAFYVGYVDQLKEHGLVTYFRAGNREGVLQCYQLKKDKIISKEIAAINANLERDRALYEKYFGNATNVNRADLKIKTYSQNDLKRMGFSPSWER